MKKTNRIFSLSLAIGLGLLIQSTFAHSLTIKEISLGGGDTLLETIIQIDDSSLTGSGIEDIIVQNITLTFSQYTGAGLTTGPVPCACTTTLSGTPMSRDLSPASIFGRFENGVYQRYWSNTRVRLFPPDGYWDMRLQSDAFLYANTYFLVRRFGRQSTVISPVPEPSTWLLMLAGLLGLVWFRRRNKGPGTNATFGRTSMAS